MIQEKLFGNIGLNLDDDPRYFGDDDTDLIQNMLPDMDGAAGNQVTHPGNIEIPTGITWIMTDTQRVIGSTKRPENDIIYYFVKGLSIHGSDVTTTTTTTGFDYNDALDNEYNSIIEFNPITETFRVIVFEEEHLYMGDWVYGAKVFGEYIIYNSIVRGMQKVHIEYAYRYYNGIPLPTYPTITETTFALRNMPPVDRPTCEYITNGLLQNNILNKTFQFAYRYKYVDGGYSVYSEFSDICLPPNVEAWNGDYVYELYDYNTIRVTFTRGDEDVIEFVEVIVREGNDGDWRFYTKVEDASTTYIDFSNSENYESVDQDEVNKAEDAIPRTVADGTLVNENRIVVAGVTEGFDNIDIDVVLAPAVEELTINAATYAVLATRTVLWEGAETFEPYYSINISDLTKPDNYDDGDVLRIHLNLNGVIYSSDYTLLAPDTATLGDMSGRIVTQLNALLGYGTIGTATMILAPGQPASGWNLNNTDDYDIEIELSSIYDRITSGYVQVIDGTTSNSSNKWNTYKSDAVHPHAIQYWDEEFRRSTIQRSTACDVYVGERGALHDDIYYRVKLNWSINHTPPSWARYWSWVYAGNKTQSSFIQYIVQDTAVQAAPLDNYLGFNIAPLQDLKTDTAVNAQFGDSIIDPYSWVPGDRVRIIVDDDGAGDFDVPYTGDEYYDLPIMGINGDYILVPNPTAGTYGVTEGTLIEIYTPRTFEEESELYYPVGDIYDIIDGYHKGQTQHQGAAQPAMGVLECGDAYIIARAFSYNLPTATTGTMYPVESMHWSDFYVSNDYNRGRPNIYSTIGEVTQNNVRWGNKHLTGSSVDNMYTFDPLDYKSTTDIYGDIVRIGEMGDVLKVIFERKVASMYIGKTEYIDASGSAVLTISDSVLSNPNYSLDDYGTTVPQAVIFVRGYCYFIDLYSGCIVRNTNNGSYPISGKVDSEGEGADYKMHRYFRDICSAVRTTGQDNVMMLMGWDDGRKLLYVSILHPSIEERTVAFRESRGRWVAFLDFVEDLTNYYPTCYEYAGEKFYSFLDFSDSVWSHTDSSSTDLTIYDEPKTAYINVWGQAYPNKIKVFDSIAIHTDARGWRGLVYIPEGISYGAYGMESRLPATGFEVRENVMYAPYLFNALDGSGTFVVPRLYYGETLRGYVIQNKLYTTTAAHLFKVDINYRISNV